MAVKAEKKESATPHKVREITFKCRFCEKVKPYRDMVMLTRYFPPLTACQSCALKLEYAAEEPSQEV